MSNNDIASRHYNIESFKLEPVVALAKLIKFDSHIPFIRANRESVLPILTGIVLYRQLNRNSQSSVLEQAQALGNREFFGKVSNLIAQNIAQPYWNPWCLSDTELRSFFETNKSVADFLSTWFITIDTPKDAASIAGAIYLVSQKGVTGYLKEAVSNPAVDALFKKISSNALRQTASKGFFVAIMIASVMKKFSESDAEAAKKELLARGLLTADDLG
ncbi:hypothetical protein WH50_23020 [Pokkaliibacter plantistimulans]|uniref:Uncharacterized protein n=1 Tax=Pokkaliibacter plantistimulans TaxID=1635171 RepID=A0ABX5LQU3_9GAMM|nr:hypothetical protein [Pokkaliibacter plantistimulans]PXF29044.1 hypothetical protein WH50_23020 [Pokkaliibacter plantistimulans]